jgi:hypothetical protein
LTLLKTANTDPSAMRSFAAIFAIIIVTLALLTWRGMAAALLRHQGTSAVAATIVRSPSSPKNSYGLTQ